MRKRNKAFLSCAILAGVLLAAMGARADQCTAGGYAVSTSGPVVGTNSTQITYKVSGSNSPDHVATSVASGSTDCVTRSILSVTGSNPTGGNQFYPPAAGDPVTGLGKWACHEEAAKINPNANVAYFTVTVSGVRSPAPKSVVVKKGNNINSCEIVGIGDQAADTPAPVTEIIKEPGSQCAVEFTLDRVTGKVLHAQVTGDSVGNCSLSQTPVTNLNLSVTGVVNCPVANQLQDGSCSLGPAKFGEGYVHSGSNSCTSRIIGGTLYSWGAPCP
jgi:hypothetical protein